MTKLHQCEVLEYRETGLARTVRLAVPGGWLYAHYPLTGSMISLGMVPDPTAPHCQPTPPADDRPPMTDEALRAWLTATYGEPRENSAGSLAWGYSIPGRGQVDNVWRVNASRWYIPGNALEYCLPASIAGPALWAAHRYGTP
jgi:hypothetical protein